GGGEPALPQRGRDPGPAVRRGRPAVRVHQQADRSGGGSAGCAGPERPVRGDQRAGRGQPPQAARRAHPRDGRADRRRCFPHGDGRRQRHRCRGRAGRGRPVRGGRVRLYRNSARRPGGRRPDRRFRGAAAGGPVTADPLYAFSRLVCDKVPTIPAEPRSRLQSPSLAKKLLRGIFAVSLVAVGLSFAGAYQVFHSRFEAQKVSDLEMYARERTRTEQSLFTQLNAKYAGATREMIDRYESMEPEATWRELDRFFPLQADGTRRSIPELYDGISDGAGGRIFGMAAFIPDAASMTDDEAKVILAAARIVFASGPSGFETFDNFYFFTPQNRLVMFGPAREDRLIYYRRDAPPDFNFQHEEMSRLVRPELNPAGVMRCTRLRRLIAAPGTRRLSAGCYQPVSIDRRPVGARGVSIPVGDRLMRSGNDVPAGATGRFVW